jgi:hypothetical protein
MRYWRIGRSDLPAEQKLVDNAAATPVRLVGGSPAAIYFRIDAKQVLLLAIHSRQDQVQWQICSLGKKRDVLG